MVLRNYIELPMGAPTKLHFVSGDIVPKTIHDALLGVDKQVNTLILHCDRLNGEPVSALYSITSEKLAAKLYPFVTDGTLASHNFTITRNGSGFTTSYTVDVQ